MFFASLAAPSTYMRHPLADQTSQPSKTAQAPPHLERERTQLAEYGGIGGARRGITWSRSKGLEVILTAWNAEAKLTSALSRHHTINTPEKGFLSVWPRTHSCCALTCKKKREREGKISTPVLLVQLLTALSPVQLRLQEGYEGKDAESLHV